MEERLFYGWKKKKRKEEKRKKRNYLRINLLNHQKVKNQVSMQAVREAFGNVFPHESLEVDAEKMRSQSPAQSPLFLLDNDLDPVLVIHDLRKLVPEILFLQSIVHFFQSRAIQQNLQAVSYVAEAQRRRDSLRQ